MGLLQHHALCFALPRRSGNISWEIFLHIMTLDLRKSEFYYLEEEVTTHSEPHMTLIPVVMAGGS